MQPRVAARNSQQNSGNGFDRMSAILFIVETLASLIVYVFLLRLLLQLARADFRNPIAQAIVRITNPVIVPLRRILPPVGKVDSASVVAVVLLVLAEVAMLHVLRGLGLPNTLPWLQLAAYELARSVLWLYFYAIFLYALISLVAQGQGSPIQYLLASLCEPVLQPIRRLIPPFGGLDLSPLWAAIAIQALLILLR